MVKRVALHEDHLHWAGHIQTAADRLGNKLKSTVFMCDAKVEGSIPILIMHWPLGP